MKTLLQLQNIQKSFGGKKILNGASVTIPEKQKIGVIGRNGAGKTTLLRIITGEEEADAGEIVESDELRIGYLSQEDPFRAGEGVLEFLVRISGKEEWECGRIAGRFQLKNELLVAKIEDLSGGYQMRVRLAAMLLAEPNLLLLDEPTNYLDLNTLLLLERFLREYSGGYLIVSHDREFLMNTCAQTLETDNGEIFLFPGRLEDYLEFKEERRAMLLRQNRNIEARRRQLESFVERFRAKASKAAQARSKEKQLGRLKKIEIDHPLRNVRIRMPAVKTRGRGTALRAEGLSMGYPSHMVAADIELDIRRGAHVAILGENGQGKSTLLKTLAGAIPPLDGEIRRGEERIAYYAQHVYAALDENQDVFGYLGGAAAADVSRQEILNMAGSFLFRGDDVRLAIRVLSGGERARLSLAGLLLGKHSVLLMDEPTNHLDFETVEALGYALREYAGTVLFVSHDRTFVNLIATDIIEIRGGAVSHYPGSYEEYVFGIGQRLEEEPEESGRPQTRSTNVSERQSEQYSEQQPVKKAHQLKKELKSDLNRNRKLLTELEGRLEDLEREKDEILAHITENPDDYSRERNERLAEITQLVAVTEERWLELQHELERLENLMSQKG